MSSRKARLLRPLLATAVGAVFIAAGAVPSSAAGPTTVDLGTAAEFSVLGAQTVTNTGGTVLGDAVGVSPGSAVTGFPPGVADGLPHESDQLANEGQAAALTAYNDAASRIPTGPTGVELGGQTLVGGVYNGGAIQLTGTVVLDGQDDPSSVWIFQAASSLTTAPSSTVSLINGADACNVFWQVTSSATIDTNSTFAGTILANTSVWARTGASVEGRLLALNGEVTLDTNTVNTSTCAAGATTTTSTTSTAPPATAAPTTTTTTAAPTTTTTAAPTTTTTAPTTTTAAPTTPATTPTAPTPTPTPGDIPTSGAPFGSDGDELPPIVGDTPPTEPTSPPDAPATPSDAPTPPPTAPQLPETGSTAALLTLIGLAFLAAGAVLTVAAGRAAARDA